MSNLLEKASIITTPTAYSDGKLHSVKPVQHLGDEKVTNGDFATDSDWTLGSGWNISDGKLNADSATGYAIQSGVFKSGVSETYEINLTVSNYVSGYFTIITGGVTAQSQQFNANGNYTIYFNTNNPSNTNLHFTHFGAFTGSIDNVSIKEVIDADFDFQRGSAATRVNSQGLIEMFRH